MKALTIVLFIFGYTFAYSQPKIQIEGNDVYDWGKINPKGKPLIAKVKIFNKGTETLNITEVKPGCGCTTAPLDKNNIEPKGYATLSITLNVSNDGPVHKSIRITSNDPKTPTKNLSLKAEIMSPIGLSQKFLVFSNMEINKEAISKVIIKNNSSKTIQFLKIITEPKELITNIKKNTRIPANKEFTLEVKYTPKSTSNLFGKVTLKTNNKEMETLEISVGGNIAPAKNK